MGRYQEALADLNYAIELDQESDWKFSERGDIYFLLGRNQEALADFDHAIALDEKEDWYRYCRALIYMLTSQTNAFEDNIQAAIKLAQISLDNTPNNWRIGFNLALYNLVCGNISDAEEQYDRLRFTCPILPRLQAAVNDLTELLTFQPSNELAQRI